MNERCRRLPAAVVKRQQVADRLDPIPRRRLDPWRDTGIVIEGPAVADLELAFGETWAAAGVPRPTTDAATKASMPPVGTVMARVVAGTQTTAQLYRLDQLIAAGARRSLWLTDAYSVGTTSYVQALTSDATDGVDVRGHVACWEGAALAKARWLSTRATDALDK